MVAGKRNPSVLIRYSLAAYYLYGTLHILFLIVSLKAYEPLLYIDIIVDFLISIGVLLNARFIYFFILAAEMVGVFDTLIAVALPAPMHGRFVKINASYWESLAFKIVIILAAVRQLRQPTRDQRPGADISP